MNGDTPAGATDPVADLHDRARRVRTSPRPARVMIDKFADSRGSVTSERRRRDTTAGGNPPFGFGAGPQLP